MGNGIVLPDNVKASVATALTEEYHTLCAAGMSEDEIRDKLSALFTQLTTEHTTSSSSTATAVDDEHTSAINEIHAQTLTPTKQPSSSLSQVTSPVGSEKKTYTVRTNRTNSLRMENLSPKHSASHAGGISFPFQAQMMNHHHSNANSNSSSNIESSSSKSSTPSSTKLKPGRSQRHSMINTSSGKGLLARTKSYHDSVNHHKPSSHQQVPSNDAIDHLTKDEDDHKEDDDKIIAIEITPSSSSSSSTDNWDSVSKQPYCNICKMAFKSPAFLDRHIKYSEVHQKTLEEMNMLHNGHHFISSIQADDDPLASSSSYVRASIRQMVKAVDGVDFRQIYHGVKFYWRTKENIDFDIFYHIKSHLIEVVPYDMMKSKEYMRLYFHGDMIYDIIHDDVEAAVDEKVKELSSDRFAAIPARALIYAELQQHACVTYLLSRLQKVEHDIIFISNTSSSSSSPMISSPPSSLLPVMVIRRSLTGIEESKPLNQPDVLFVPSTPANHHHLTSSSSSEKLIHDVIHIQDDGMKTAMMSSESSESSMIAIVAAEATSHVLSSIMTMQPSPVKASMIKAKEV